MALIGSVLGVAAVSLVLGAVTSWAQGLLPDAWHPLANSPSGWAALTALAVMAQRPSLRRGALLGTVSFVCLVLGYTFASELRGLAYDPTLWGAIGLVSGPFVGVAAAGAASTRTMPVALGSGVLAGVLVADGIYGLTVVADSTSPVYWTTVLVLGLLLVLATPLVRLRRVAPTAVMVVTFLAATAALSGGYAWLNAAPPV
ncbi:DUF6518 family protein [Nocardioides zhouii]|uniref:Uncharacterized protein n=1 Tax=Nocardioides zhouii TaxID=1168729 RepID=A0A4Q2SJM4_9ACTN|nr:DUF6518 family protein [Nocardioides zhouii]RYC05786.1 hypothetical protein EUA94_17105 [Nocardioides zhouii]